MNDIDVRQIRILIHTVSVINVEKFVKLKFLSSYSSITV